MEGTGGHGPEHVRLDVERPSSFAARVRDREPPRDVGRRCRRPDPEVRPAHVVGAGEGRSPVVVAVGQDEPGHGLAIRVRDVALDPCAGGRGHGQCDAARARLELRSGLLLADPHAVPAGHEARRLEPTAVVRVRERRSGKPGRRILQLERDLRTCDGLTVRVRDRPRRQIGSLDVEVHPAAARAADDDGRRGRGGPLPQHVRCFDDGLARSHAFEDVAPVGSGPPSPRLEAALLPQAHGRPADAVPVHGDDAAFDRSEGNDAQNDGHGLLRERHARSDDVGVRDRGPVGTRRDRPVVGRQEPLEHERPVGAAGRDGARPVETDPEAGEGLRTLRDHERAGHGPIGRVDDAPSHGASRLQHEVALHLRTLGDPFEMCGGSSPRASHADVDLVGGEPAHSEAPFGIRPEIDPPFPSLVEDRDVRGRDGRPPPDRARDR